MDDFGSRDPYRMPGAQRVWAEAPQRRIEPPFSGGPRPRRGQPNWTLPLLLLLAAVVGWQLFGKSRGSLYDPEARPREVTPRGDLAGEEQSNIELFKRASPSVVHVTNLAVRRNYLTLNLEEIPQGTGTGFIWDEEGRVVTNYHVVRGGSAFVVTLADRSEWDAVNIGYDIENDLAVLQLQGDFPRLPPIDIGRSDDLQVGQRVFAIGNPFGLDQTLTTGIISGLGRQFYSLTERPIDGAIQTDAAINPGNSGGPLLDSAGRLIGVNTAILSPSGANSGVGFAVPVDTVNQIVPSLVRGGDRVGLGIHIAADHIARRYGHDGVLIIRVDRNSPAEKAGLRGTLVSEDDRLIRFGDVITALGARRVRCQLDLFSALAEYEAGDQVDVRIMRDQVEAILRVRLERLGE